MSTNNYILNLLNIKDTNIHILTDKLINKVIKGKNYQIIEAILTYKPDFCPCCGCINESSNDIIKWGFRKNCIVKIPKVSNCKTRLILHKQRFFCKNCHNTFIAETNLVNRNKNISNNSELQIRLELMKKQSEKDIADRLDVSVLINLHMMPYFWEKDEEKGEKTRQKYQKLWGNELYNNVMTLHIADKKAH